MTDLEAPTSFNTARIKQEYVRRFYDAWNALRGDRDAPARKDFLAEYFVKWWPHMFLIDVDHGANEPSFTYRVVGTDLEFLLGRGLSEQRPGTRPDPLWGGAQVSAYGKCVKSVAPVHHYMRMAQGGDAWSEFERLVLPLSNDGETVAQLIGCVVYKNFFKKRVY